MKLPEVHIWRSKYGRVERVEFRDGPERMEMRVWRIVSSYDANDGVPRVEFAVIAKPIYHDIEDEDDGDGDD